MGRIDSVIQSSFHRTAASFCFLHRAGAPELNQLWFSTLQPTFLRDRFIRSPRRLCYLTRKTWNLPSGKASSWLSTSPPAPDPSPDPGPEHHTHTIPARPRPWAAAVSTTEMVMPAPQLGMANTVVAATAAVAPRAAHQVAAAPAPGATRVAEATVGITAIHVVGPGARARWRNRLQRQASRSLRKTRESWAATVQSTDRKLCRLLSSG